MIRVLSHFMVFCCIIAVSAAAAASRVQGVQLSLDERSAVVVVEVQNVTKRPTIRTSAGHVKMWIPNAQKNVRLESLGDGKAISWVRVRPGISGSSLVDVRIGSRERIDESSLSVQTSKEQVILKIPRELISASLQGSAKARNADSQYVSSLTAKSEETNGGFVDKVNAKASGDAKKAQAKPPLAALATAQSPLRSAKSKGLPKIVFLIASLLLAGAAIGAAKVFRGKGGARNDWSEIQVLGSKRLGPKHQLVLVRALGEDHLLSMNGERTERIASSPASENTLSLRPQEGNGERLRLDGEDEDLLKAANRRADRVKLDSSSRFTPDSLRFGAELKSFVGRRLAQLDETVGVSSSAASSPARNASSPAVAGLVKLRRQAG